MHSHLWAIFSKLPDPLRQNLEHLWTSISRLSVKRRKCIVLLCRAQCVIEDDPSNLLCIQTELDKDPRMHLDDPELGVYRDLVLRHRYYLESPNLSSIVLDFCRSAPLEHRVVKETKESMFWKEVAICERSERPRHFDYSCWMDPSEFGRPIMAGTPPNPKMAQLIYNSITNWIRRLEGRLLYPRMSRKAVSRTTVKEWEALTGIEWVSNEADGGVEFTQESLERVYHETGIELQGPCELRQKWYRSGVVPRTYFAQGGTAYSKSKFIQEPAGMLVEELDTTHPILRLNPARVRLKHRHEYLRIYDLSGFTSNHWECKHFLDALAERCHGVVVLVMDAREGVSRADLGALISDYNQSMNYFPSYDPTVFLGDDVPLLHHNQAGFLGVYGNINFSTFLHGASLLMALDSTDDANVAGDDAHYRETPGHEDDKDRIIRANGSFEESKTFRSDQIGAVCLKRGVLQTDEMILPKLMAVFPSWSLILNALGLSTPQHPRPDVPSTELISVVCNDIYRYLRYLSATKIEEDLRDVHDLLSALYSAFRLPREGCLPPWSETLVPVLPPSPIQLLESPIDLLLDYHFDEGCFLPKNGISYIYDPPVVISFPQGYEWSSRSSKLIRYLVSLDYLLKVEKVEELVVGAEAYQRIRDMFEGRLSKVYTYRVVREVPYHLVSDNYEFYSTDL